MNLMENPSEHSEEIYLAKRKTHFGYAMIHIVLRDNSLPKEQLNFFSTMDYYHLINYLKGASLGKDSNILNIYNGMSDDIKNKDPLHLLSDSKIYPLKEKVLEEILSDAGLKDKFKDKIKTIN